MNYVEGYTVLFVQIVLKLTIYNLLSLVPILPFTKGEVSMTCRENKYLIMSCLLRIYKRYDHDRNTQIEHQVLFLTPLNF